MWLNSAFVHIPRRFGQNNVLQFYDEHCQTPHTVGGGKQCIGTKVIILIKSLDKKKTKNFVITFGKF